jgi:hypothetical protein
LGHRLQELDEEGLSVVLELGVAVSGRVVDAGGRGVAGLVLSASRAGSAGVWLPVTAWNTSGICKVP